MRISAEIRQWHCVAGSFRKNVEKDMRTINSTRWAHSVCIRRSEIHLKFPGFKKELVTHLYGTEPDLEKTGPKFVSSMGRVCRLLLGTPRSGLQNLRQSSKPQPKALFTLAWIFLAARKFSRTFLTFLASVNTLDVPHSNTIGFVCAISQRKSWSSNWSWISRCEKNTRKCELAIMDIPMDKTDLKRTQVLCSRFLEYKIPLRSEK